MLLTNLFPPREVTRKKPAKDFKLAALSAFLISDNIPLWVFTDKPQPTPASFGVEIISAFTPCDFKNAEKATASDRERKAHAMYSINNFSFA